MMGGRMHRSAGMSLLELLVAMVIMAMALGALYRSMGGSARAAGDADRYQQAIFVAQGLLFANSDLPESGWNEEGRSGELHWVVQSRPYVTTIQQNTPGAVPLHELRVTIDWTDGGRARSLELDTFLPQRVQLASGGAR